MRWLLELGTGPRRLLTLGKAGICEYVYQSTGLVTLFGQTAQELPKRPLLRLKQLSSSEKAAALRAEAPGRQFSQRAGFPATPRVISACALWSGVVRARVFKSITKAAEVSNSLDESANRAQADGF